MLRLANEKTTIPLISVLTLSTSVHTRISDKSHKKCSDAGDYASCVNTYKKFSPIKDKEISGIGIKLFEKIDLQLGQ